MLRQLRQAAGLSLCRLAELSYYDKGYLSKVENGRKPMTVKLARACDGILDGRGELIGRAVAAATVGRAGRLPLAQLPAAPRQLFGRQWARERIEQLLVPRVATPGSVPVVCVEGPVGVGKTALALQCAHSISPRFDDGVLYVNLQGHGRAVKPVTPVQVLGSFARALGAQADLLPDSEDELAAVYRSLLADRSILVVLDNAASSAQVRPLLPGAGRCAVVVTSRKHLVGLLLSPSPPEALSLGPLPPGPAVDLIRSVVGDPWVDSELKGLAEVARRCGYLPLVLRTAAVWLVAHPVLGVAEVNRLLQVGVSGLPWLPCADGGEADPPAVAAASPKGVVLPPATARGVPPVCGAPELVPHRGTTAGGPTAAGIPRDPG